MSDRIESSVGRAQIAAVIFDVDGTLIDENDRPRFEVVNLLRALAMIPVPIGVWSGGGKPYAEMWVRRLWLEDDVDWVGAKGDTPPGPVLFTVDDAPEFDFGVPNLPV